MVSRTERTTFAAWWWTVDKLMLAALATLMLAGIVLSLAASPPVAARHMEYKNVWLTPHRVHLTFRWVPKS